MTTMQSATRAADWDMGRFFAGVGSDDFRSFTRTLRDDLLALDTEAPSETPAWTDYICRLEDVGARCAHLQAYLECLGAADARDEAVKEQIAALASTRSQYSKLLVGLRAYLRELDDGGFAALCADDKLAPIRYFLRRQREESQRSMNAAEEKLAAELGVDGIHAWGRLYDQITGTLNFTLAPEGKESKEIPVAMARSLLEDADPAVRRATFTGSAKAWESVSEILAACLNAIAGTRLSLYQRRGVEHFLAPALHDAGIERATLDAMFDAVRSRQEMVRGFLRRKAKLLGKDSLGFWDIGAPLPMAAAGESIDWNGAKKIVSEAFGSAYPALGAMADKAFAEKWIDHTPRASKRPGGFCAPSPIAKESRIFMTFNGTMGDVETLAHELGHSFHSYLMRDMRAWAQEYPMTLAETASTFGENVVTSAALANTNASAAERLAILHQRMDAAVAFLLNIPTRFDFESRFYEQRKSGELSVAQFKSLMVQAQRDNYGDVLSEDGCDPWFWASKLHFFISDLSFYNFPYTFGYLFSMGIFKRFLDQGEAFLPNYEKLLRMTGSATAEDVAQECLGVDLRKPDFWLSSIDLIEADYNEFCRLADELAG